VPRSPEERLERWERRTTPWIVVAAVLPLLDVFTTGQDTPGKVAVALACWAVFAVDLVVHLRLRPGYLHTKLGIFDLVVVVGTFPWYLIPGLGGTAVMMLLRLGRLARVVVLGVKSPAVKRLLHRLGTPALAVAIAVFVAAGVVERSEGPPVYPDFGVALWWAFVTVTTVGYGDVVPETTEARVIAVLLMLVGVALLGTVAASLASFFSELSRKQTGDAPAQTHAALDQLQRSVDELRAEIASLRGELPGTAARDRHQSQ
jgi:voltage-gated potassium channel